MWQIRKNVSIEIKKIENKYFYMKTVDSICILYSSDYAQQAV